MKAREILTFKKLTPIVATITCIYWGVQIWGECQKNRQIGDHTVRIAYPHPPTETIMVTNGVFPISNDCVEMNHRQFLSAFGEGRNIVIWLSDDHVEYSTRVGGATFCSTKQATGSDALTYNRLALEATNTYGMKRVSVDTGTPGEISMRFIFSWPLAIFETIMLSMIAGIGFGVLITVATLACFHVISWFVRLTKTVIRLIAGLFQHTTTGM